MLLKIHLNCLNKFPPQKLPKTFVSSESDSIFASTFDLSDKIFNVLRLERTLKYYKNDDLKIVILKMMT